MSSQLIRVRCVAGTHHTNTVRGQRASSTAGYEPAAQALCHKLYPDRGVQLVRKPMLCNTGVETFEVVA